MSDLISRIRAGEILISDGASGTMLMERGLKPGDSPDLFNLTHPNVIKEVAIEYLKAGADIIHTCTFGASLMKLSERGDESKTEEVNRAAVEILKEIDVCSFYISASIGPSGKILEPYGDTSAEEVFEGYVRQISALCAAGIDCITIETMIDINEAELAIKAAKSIAPEVPVIATMTFNKIPRGFFTVMGTDVKTASALLEEAGADIIGSNCGNGIDIMVEIAKEFKAATSLPVIIQSNAGAPEMIDGEVKYPESRDYFTCRVELLIEIGVSVIGGCCGTSPNHIKKIRALLDAEKQ